MAKPTTKAPTPDTTAPDNEEQKTNIDNMAALDSMADTGLILTANGLARCNSALSGIEAITDILFQLGIDKDCTGGIQANSRTTGGLTQALAVCTSYLGMHLNGYDTRFYAKTINVETPAYAELMRMQRSD